MPTKLLAAINAAFGLGLAFFVWGMLPFAQGVQCEAQRVACPAAPVLYRVAFALIPAVTFLALAWLGTKLATRKRVASYALLVAGPLAVCCWVIVVWAGTTS